MYVYIIVCILICIRLHSGQYVLVHVVGLVVEGLACINEASAPVKPPLLRIRLLRVVEVQMSHVRQHHLHMQDL